MNLTNLTNQKPFFLGFLADSFGAGRSACPGFDTVVEEFLSKLGSIREEVVFLRAIIAQLPWRTFVKRTRGITEPEFYQKPINVLLRLFLSNSPLLWTIGAVKLR